jgi:hypothetical protein
MYCTITTNMGITQHILHITVGTSTRLLKLVFSGVSQLLDDLNVSLETLLVC